MHHSTEGIAPTTAFVTPVVEHWLEREIAQSVIKWLMEILCEFLNLVSLLKTVV